jgi:hypothetical protein
LRCTLVITYLASHEGTMVPPTNSRGEKSKRRRLLDNNPRSSSSTTSNVPSQSIPNSINQRPALHRVMSASQLRPPTFTIQRGPLSARVVQRRDRRYNHLRIDEFLYEADIAWPRNQLIRAQSSVLPMLDQLIHEVRLNKTNSQRTIILLDRRYTHARTHARTPDPTPFRPPARPSGGGPWASTARSFGRRPVFGRRVWRSDVAGARAGRAVGVRRERGESADKLTHLIHID